MPYLEVKQEGLALLLRRSAPSIGCGRSPGPTYRLPFPPKFIGPAPAPLAALSHRPALKALKAWMRGLHRHCIRCRFSWSTSRGSRWMIWSTLSSCASSPISDATRRQAPGLRGRHCVLAQFLWSHVAERKSYSLPLR